MARIPRNSHRRTVPIYARQQTVAEKGDWHSINKISRVPHVRWRGAAPPSPFFILTRTRARAKRRREKKRKKKPNTYVIKKGSDGEGDGEKKHIFFEKCTRKLFSHLARIRPTSTYPPFPAIFSLIRSSSFAAQSAPAYDLSKRRGAASCEPVAARSSRSRQTAEFTVASIHGKHHVILSLFASEARGQIKEGGWGITSGGGTKSESGL